MADILNPLIFNVDNRRKIIDVPITNVHDSLAKKFFFKNSLKESKLSFFSIITFLSRRTFDLIRKPALLEGFAAFEGALVPLTC